MPSGVKASWAVVGITAVLLALLSFQGHLPHYLLHNGLLAPIFAALVLWLAWSGLENGPVGRLASTTTLVLLGEASYAIYILHAPLLKLFLGFSAKFYPAAFHGRGMTTLSFMVYLGVTIGASILSFKLVEVPARGFIKKWFRGGPRAAAKKSVSHEPHLSDLLPAPGLHLPVNQR